MFYILVLQFLLKKWAKTKTKMIPFMRKKTKEKQSSATNMISVDEIGIVFRFLSWKLQGESFE